jgi:uncharacterized protein YyaL (SSP411 family)
MSQISWRVWGEDAFSEAREQDRPILLSIVAPWCQFCKAMDEQTYGNEAIAQYIADNFVPVRVDSDRRPDVNARYTQGGWPSTCLLTPEGDLLWGGTFVPADGLAQLLPQFLGEFKNNKQGLAQHVAQLREQLRQNNASAPLDLSVPVSPEIPFGVLMSAKFEFDFAFGGFGHGGQKFPHTDGLELVMEQFAKSVQAGEPDGDLQLMLERTFMGLANGALHDGLDGGFFRYTQAPNWQNPQFEKLLEDNAQLLRTISRAYSQAGSDGLKGVAEKTFGYLQSQLYDVDRGLWGGSQFADAEYYAQDADGRKVRSAPAVDKTVLTGPNAQAARACVAYWGASGDASALVAARKAVDYLWENHREVGGALKRHDGEGAPVGLLADTARLAAACLDLYEAGQGITYLDRAESLVKWAGERLSDPVGGGLWDAPVYPDALGNLKVGARDAGDNMLIADTLSRLFLLTGDESHVQSAEKLIKAFQPAVPNLGFFAAPVALAIERMASLPLLVHVVGAPSDEKTKALVAAAHRPYRFERVVQPLDPSDEDDAALIDQLGYSAEGGPTAFSMFVSPQGESRLAPTTDPDTLVETLRSARPELA